MVVPVTLVNRPTRWSLLFILGSSQTQRNIVLYYATGDTLKEQSQRPVTSETFDDGTAPNKKKDIDKDKDK